MTPDNPAYRDSAEVLGMCDNCAEPVMEDDDCLSDAEGIIHERCNPDA